MNENLRIHRTAKKTDLIILYSGGADSRLMIEFALLANKTPMCLLVDYGQLHKEELDVAKTQLKTLGILYREVAIKGLEVNSGLTGSGDKNMTGEVHEMHVPGRNSMFLSIAYSIAESLDIDTIWIGADWSDRLNVFPDCYQEYYVAFNEMLKHAGPKTIKVEAPLMGLSKETIMNILGSKGIKESDIYSGYGEL